MEGGLTKSQITNCILSIFGILGNTLTIQVFVRDKNLLKKSYNVFVLCLAVSDVLTHKPRIWTWWPYSSLSNEVVGTILCRVFWSRVFLFQLLFFTVYITLLLTIERWVAVVKPSKYGIAFKGKRLTGYLIFCWIWSFFLTGEGILDSVYEPNSSSHDICTVKFIFSGSILRASQTVLNIIMKTFFPCLSMIGLYVHMIVTTNNFPVASAASKAKLRVTRKDD